MSGELVPGVCAGRAVVEWRPVHGRQRAARRSAMRRRDGKAGTGRPAGIDMPSSYVRVHDMDRCRKCTPTARRHRTCTETCGRPQVSTFGHGRRRTLALIGNVSAAITVPAVGEFESTRQQWVPRFWVPSSRHDPPAGGTVLRDIGKSQTFRRIRTGHGRATKAAQRANDRPSRRSGAPNT